MRRTGCCQSPDSSNSAASLFQGPVVLTFEENGLEATELVVSQVYSFHKSATNTVPL